MQAAFELQAAIEDYLDRFMEFRSRRDADSLRAFAESFRTLDEVQRRRWPALAGEVREVGVAARDLVHEWLVDQESVLAYAAHESALIRLAEGLGALLGSAGAGDSHRAAHVH